MSVFRKNDSRCWSNFFETHIYWNFDHISKTFHQINYSDIWFAKVIIILIMTAEGLSFDVFFKKDPHLNAVENCKNNFLILSLGPTFGINWSFGSPEKTFKINFTKANTKFCLKLRYNADRIYFFVNGKEIFKFKFFCRLQFYW